MRLKACTIYIYSVGGYGFVNGFGNLILVGFTAQAYYNAETGFRSDII